jgi:hypothetical protein
VESCTPTPGNPELNLQLADGSRLFATMEVSSHPSVVIRKHRFELSSMRELEDRGLMDEGLRTGPRPLREPAPRLRHAAIAPREHRRTRRRNNPRPSPHGPTHGPRPRRHRRSPRRRSVPTTTCAITKVASTPHGLRSRTKVVRDPRPILHVRPLLRE